jgi:hypothetical protein
MLDRCLAEEHEENPEAVHAAVFSWLAGVLARHARDKGSSSWFER